ncbi:MAG: [FeFe] hydrogenase H-cluster maturation GTPase HydF [Clostridiaceae bacterium]|nr:[FeFe] hydrogenase H-cluster maturation GTPase HydF [Clostridiaceae bacterium]
MNNTTRGNRLHIAIFGRRNAGKSSLINALTNQDIALVSEIPGTTTDPVYKAMEILPIGPVLIIDTAGIDDEGIIGELRVQKTKEVLNKTDLALIVTNKEIGIGSFEEELLTAIEGKGIPAVIVYNKSDIIKTTKEECEKGNGVATTVVSAKTGQGIDELKETMIVAAPKDVEVSLMGNLIEKGDTVVLVTPIDSSAPKGRMILPQVQVIRDILDHDAFMVVCKETELKEALDRLKSPPKLVITDSQAFHEVSKIVPEGVPLTSFSILYARYKGDLHELVRGAEAVKKLKPGDKVLIAEGCTHHRQKDDIGTVKIPRWLEKEVGGKLDYTWVAGTKFEEDLSNYKLIVHCGACMHNRREMMYRINRAKDVGVPIVNYGVFIAYATGITNRVLQPFKMKLNQ